MPHIEFEALEIYIRRPFPQAVFGLTKETLMGYRVATGTIGPETCPLEILSKESPLKTPNTGTIIPVFFFF